MLILNSTSDLLKLVTSANVNTDVYASWVDNASGTFTADRVPTPITTAASTTIVGSPGSSTQRTVGLLTIRNTDATLTQTVTLQHYDGTTTASMLTWTLQPGDTLMYVEKTGFTLIDATSGQSTTIGRLGTMNNRIPTADVTIPTGYSLVVSGYYQLNAGIDLIIAAGGELLIR